MNSRNYLLGLVLPSLLFANLCAAQMPHAARPPTRHFPAKQTRTGKRSPQLVVMIVVDQMRGDYVGQI